MKTAWYKCVSCEHEFTAVPPPSGRQKSEAQIAKEQWRAAALMGVTGPKAIRAANKRWTEEWNAEQLAKKTEKKAKNV